MIEVPLTTGRYHQPSGLVMMVDDDDLPLVVNHRWRLCITRTFLYGVTGDGDLAHRLILGEQSGVRVDHLNGDGLDNRRANLRPISASQAAARSWSRAVLSHVPTSRYRGVSLVRGRSTPWRATISVNGKQRFLGYHGSEENAARVYDVAARLHFGEFAQTNFRLEE